MQGQGRGPVSMLTQDIWEQWGTLPTTLPRAAAQAQMQRWWQTEAQPHWLDLNAEPLDWTTPLRAEQPAGTERLYLTLWPLSAAPAHLTLTKLAAAPRAQVRLFRVDRNSQLSPLWTVHFAGGNHNQNRAIQRVCTGLADMLLALQVQVAPGPGVWHWQLDISQA